ncbi:hypothetical protein OV203_47740 [Nannocystis sp. ILAH1]|uniref:hypothetical protein n=1 Tax=Nannocystis sp. ILAH1 TaxID=2996789 RepID=UPI00226DF3F0|nr:hypothetical protein [Nannocystis sp. ILAH1]MCY0994913.1 hypothetical protein [Nannocystis sp. ILAH1]
MIDLTDIVFIKRIVIGSSNPADLQSEERVAEAVRLLNQCLSGQPKGRIVGIEKSFSILQVGEHNVVLQWTTYQVGFTRRPQWLQT